LIDDAEGIVQHLIHDIPILIDLFDLSNKRNDKTLFSRSHTIKDDFTKEAILVPHMKESVTVVDR